MAKLEQALILDPPAELHFKPPFVEVTTSHLLLSNPTNREICFKVKTTAPKTYCVRPNNGIVPPKKTVSVAVMLQPFDLETADRSRHKFMVQSIYAPETYDIRNFDSVWRDTPPEQFMNSKLKCIFDIPDETQQAGTQESEILESEPESKPTLIPESSPKISHDGDAEKLLSKLQKSNSRLKHELFDLRKENSTLKEEGLRSRVTYDTKSRGTLAKPAEPRLQNTPPAFQLSNSVIALSVIVLLIGIYIGKYIL